MRNNAASELGPEWQDWDRFASDLSNLRRTDRLVRKNRTLPWGPDNFEIYEGSFVDHPKVGTTHWQRWRMMLRRAEKPGDRGMVEEWRDFDRFEADISSSYTRGAVMLPIDWKRPWGPDNFLWGTQSDLSRLVGRHGHKRIIHGQHRSAIYKRWASMKNDARRAGHEIESEWLSFGRFRDDVGAGIETGLVLLRADRTRPFGPANFRLVTRQELRAHPTNSTHGQSGSLLHRRWLALRSRAIRSSGGLDPRWNEFEAFAFDVGDDRPNSDLERVDPSKPYGPENFCWIDRGKRQAEVKARRAAKRAAAQAKRDEQTVEVDGVTYRGLYALAKAYGVPSATVCLRVRQGMTPKEAVTIPNQTMLKARPTHLDGHDFPSMNSALRYVEQRYGIRPNTMQLRLKSGLSLEEAARKPLRTQTRRTSG